MKKLMAWKTKGMNRDLSVSAFNPEFAFENFNLRLATNENNTLMSWVTEKGTQSISVNKESNGHITNAPLTISGIPIGTAVLNGYLVLFTTDNNGNDNIYRLRYADTNKTVMMGIPLYQGNLGFRSSNPLETLVSFESNIVQKVYWNDNLNQPRVINIVNTYTSSGSGIETRFDFVPELDLREIVTVKKNFGNGGMFAPGVIQYAFTYYYKFGQESNIFYTTPLLPISFTDRGGSPEEKIDNTFTITITNIDSKFDYLRIYSIQRTSINAVPFCKRIQDISLRGLNAGQNYVSFTDTGTIGDTIDPQELFYKGGEVIKAGTMEQKDNTLFLGNITINRNELQGWGGTIKSGVSISEGTRTIEPLKVSTDSYIYYNQLSSVDTANKNLAPCSGFKCGDTYRLGVQFQHKSGKWSEPFYRNDYQVTNRFNESNGGANISVPVFVGTVSSSLTQTLINNGYRRVRGVAVFPTMKDRTVVCQGVLSHTIKDREKGYQSSWFFRPVLSQDAVTVNDGTISPTRLYEGVDTSLTYAAQDLNEREPFNPETFRSAEIQGNFYRVTSGDAEILPDARLYVTNDVETLHTPDAEFDEQFQTFDLSGSSLSIHSIGNVGFERTFSDIDIQTETAPISSKGAGFIHKSFSEPLSYGIVTGLFYDDFSIDDSDTDVLTPWPYPEVAFKWPVYPWQGNGSLNNDISRAANLGTASALLKKKVISNLRFANTYWKNEGGSYQNVTKAQLFYSDENIILKLADTGGGEPNDDTLFNKIYRGNVDTTLSPNSPEPHYFCWRVLSGDRSAPASFISNEWCKLGEYKVTEGEGESAKTTLKRRIKAWLNRSWVDTFIDAPAGDDYEELIAKKASVRMKYKSTPHVVIQHEGDITPIFTDMSGSYSILPIVELRKGVNNIYGGMTQDILREHNWIPCGESVPLNSEGATTYYYDYGDTYFQRWDCLKTYAYTFDDINQVVEIGSFMLETHVNIDGRYDRNRGQRSNLHMSPINFNKLNPVYSQMDNFFTYKITYDGTQRDTNYPNQITWSLTKESEAITDKWTDVTLASSMELDGDKGKVNSLTRFNDKLLCFQDTGISQILYNERAQISTVEGTPIEIGNSGKVDGKAYISDTIGCSNKWAMATTPAGIYFIDNNDKSIFLFNGQLNNLSVSGGMNSWSKCTIPSADMDWTPDYFNNFRAGYDKMNQDVLFWDKRQCVAFSEKLGAFTSFYSYEDTPFLCNVNDTGVWIKADGTLWKHQAGKYCQFFGENKHYSTTLVGNPEPTTDKIFTNLEFRACVDNEGTGEYSENTGRCTSFNFTLPFDSLETWNEYQRGIAHLGIRNGHAAFKHHSSAGGNDTLKRKFRMWRCDIPRNNAELVDVFDSTFDNTFHPAEIDHSGRDRMRNPWLYLKLQKAPAESGESLSRTEIHDVMMTYFV